VCKDEMFQGKSSGAKWNQLEIKGSKNKQRLGRRRICLHRAVSKGGPWKVRVEKAKRWSKDGRIRS